MEFMIRAFTIHFATINTEYNIPYQKYINLFTIHFATINTVTHFAQCL